MSAVWIVLVVLAALLLLAWGAQVGLQLRTLQQQVDVLRECNMSTAKTFGFQSETNERVSKQMEMLRQSDLELVSMILVTTGRKVSPEIEAMLAELKASK